MRPRIRFRCPRGRPAATLASRLRLTPVAQKILCLLFAGEYLLGSRSGGMRVLEIAACLSAIYEEPTVLAELIPSAPLRALRLLTCAAMAGCACSPSLAACSWATLSRAAAGKRS